MDDFDHSTAPMPLSAREWALLIALTLAALMVRVITAVRTIDVTGDGPTHARIAYAWARHPHLGWWGQWLPGNMYLAGACTMAYPDPMIAPRALNLVLGTLTIPLFYVLVREFYDRGVATLAALALASLPLHIALSASSLTEVSFLFFVLAALLCLERALLAQPVRHGWLALFVIFLIMASMTRYEGWALIALAICYLYWRTRNITMTILVGAALIAFPLEWLVADRVHFGSALYGVSLSTSPLEGATHFGPWASIMEVARVASSILGWLLMIAALAGGARELWLLVQRRIGGGRAWYAILTVAIWSMILATEPVRGPSLYTRLLTLGCTLALPFAMLLLLEILRRFDYRIAIVALVVLGSNLMVYRAGAETWVTREIPTEMIAIARWLRSSPYRNDAVLTTKMEWQSAYLPLYDPDVADRFAVVSVWASDATLREFVRRKKPALLVTWLTDRIDRERVEGLLGIATTADRRVYEAGRTQVFDITQHGPAPTNEH